MSTKGSKSQSPASDLVPSRLEPSLLGRLTEADLIDPSAETVAQIYGNEEAQRRLSDDGTAESDPRAREFFAGGVPLDSQTAAWVDRGFGQSVSGTVKVHVDEISSQVLASMGNPLAAALGSHVLVRADAWRPGTPEYTTLMVHEVTHVLQSGTEPVIEDLSEIQPSGAGSHEAEADRNVSTMFATLGEHGRSLSSVDDAIASHDLGTGAMFSAQESASSGRAHRCIGGCSPRTQTLQEWLQDKLQGHPPSHRTVVDKIHGASVANRRQALNDGQLRTRIQNAYTGPEATTILSALLEGSQEWRNPPGNDFFDYFVTQNGTGTLPNTDTMNCWESIMYAAYLAGEVSAAWIRNFYQTAQGSGDPNAAIWAQLNFSTALPTYSALAGQSPAVGDLVFYKASASAVPGHVAVSLGGDQVMSLWNQPNNIDAVQ